jgi:hypothetical protein
VQPLAAQQPLAQQPHESQVQTGPQSAAHAQESHAHASQQHEAADAISVIDALTIGVPRSTKATRMNKAATAFLKRAVFISKTFIANGALHLAAIRRQWHRTSRPYATPSVPGCNQNERKVGHKPNHFAAGKVAAPLGSPSAEKNLPRTIE